MISLRALSGKIGISVAMLSNVLNGTKHLSVESAFKISKWLKLKGPSHDYLIDLVQYETIKCPQIRLQLAKRFAICHSYSNPEATQKISGILDTTKTSRIITYGKPNTHVTRSLHLLSDKKNGKPSPHFFDCFLDPISPRTGMGFFIQTPKSQLYQAFLDNMLEGGLSFFQYYPQNNNIIVEKDCDGFPTIRSVALTTDFPEEFYYLGDFIYSEETLKFEGVAVYFRKAQKTEPYENVFYRLN